MDKQISFRIDGDTYDQLLKRSKDQGDRSIQSIIREAIREMLPRETVRSALSTPVGAGAAEPQQEGRKTA
ncbi:MAG: ribbon-helix-helix protein, CopG family [Verrucomicrobiota bacterium]